jgi:hypothetical protein
MERRASSTRRRNIVDRSPGSHFRSLKKNGPEQTTGIEMIDPKQLPAWRQEAFSRIETESDRRQDRKGRG